MKKSHERIRMNIKSLFSLKIIIIMRNILFLLFVSTLQLIAETSYSQDTKISLNLHNVSIESVLNEIEKQSDFYFALNSELIDIQRQVDIEVDNQPISKILSLIFSGSNVKYQVMDQQILLSPGEYIPENAASRQIQTVSGRITDVNGIPLPGVNVTIKGTTTGTITNLKGEYQIDVKKLDAILVVSYVGYTTQEIEIGDQTVIDIVLLEDVLGLEEIVVVGYGSQKKINLTGAVDVITSDALADRPVSTVGEALQGVSPNLNISITDNAGEPGGGSSWNLRGIGSISGNDSPLILVDGVAMDISVLDPSSIESVSVLKDAAAAAIYGSRAPFGVVLITTKQGKKGQGFTLHYNNNFGFASPIRLPRFVSSLELVTAFNQATANSKLSPKFPDEQVDRIRRHMDGTYLPQYDTIRPPTFMWAGRHNGNANINWMDEYYAKNAPRQKHTISMEGGSKKTQYFLSAGYYNMHGLLKLGYDSYDRYNVMANVTSQVADWIRIDFKTKFSQVKIDNPVGSMDDPRAEVYNEMKTMWPMTPMYNWGVDPNDRVHAIANPIARLLESAGRDQTTKNDSWVILGTELEPVKGWKTNISFNYNTYAQKNTQNTFPIPVYNPDGSIDNIGHRTNKYTSVFDQNSYTMFNALSSYEKSLNKHFFKVMVGYEQESSYWSELLVVGRDVISSLVPSISTALGEISADDNMDHWASQAVFSRINYNYKGKYLLEINGRYNGSSKFAKDKRWGFFPSFSAGYNISEEEFWTPVKHVINKLKIRGSYGSLGNQNVPNYLYLSKVPIEANLGYVIGDARPNYVEYTPSIVSSNLTWETVTTLNMGIDVGLFNNRLGLTFDVYNRTTTDMFGPVSDLPGVLGTAVPEENNATLETKGWESTVSWKDRVSKDINYNIKVSIGDNNTTILEYFNEEGLIDNWYAGKQYGEIWGYKSDGLIQTEDEEMPNQSYFHPKWGPGDMKYQDLDGNDTINDGARTLSNHGDLTVIGNSLPHYNFGVNIGFTWKNFGFNMFWQGVLKRSFYPYYDDDYGNSSSDFWGIIGELAHSSIYQGGPLDYWRPADETNILGPNTNGYFPKPYSTVNENAKSRQTQSKYLLNAAYMRLKNIQLSYTLPSTLIAKIHLQGLRVFVSGENILTLTNLPEALDPERIDVGYYGTGQNYPLSKIFSFGFNVTF
jgi:TonB-linked SusC/RagA family outer membrane protein